MPGVGPHERTALLVEGNVPEHNPVDGTDALREHNGNTPQARSVGGGGGSTTMATSKLQEFCDSMQIDESCQPLRKGFGLCGRILSSKNLHFWLSYLLKGLAVILVLLQLVLGITISVVTALQGEKARTAVIILGALNSFVGGLAGIMQYWGQPTRESRYYSSLENVQEDVEGMLGKFRNPDVELDPWKEGERIWQTFKQAKNDAWSSEPMIWLQGTQAPEGISDHPAPRDGA